MIRYLLVPFRAWQARRALARTRAAYFARPQVPRRVAPNAAATWQRKALRGAR